MVKNEEGQVGMEFLLEKHKTLIEEINENVELESNNFDCDKTHMNQFVSDHDVNLSSNNINDTDNDNFSSKEKEQDEFIDQLDNYDNENVSSNLDSSDEIFEEGEQFKNLDEIDNLLEKPIEDIPDYYKNASKRLKRVLTYRGTDHFDVLPDGWIEVTHASGLPVYLHKKLRCCTFSRPYFLGPGSVRFHKVPESAIPCYFYQKLCQEAEMQTFNLEKNVEPEKNLESTSSANLNNTSNVTKRNEILNKLNAPGIKIKTGSDIANAQFTPDALYEYAKKRIKFKYIWVYRFKKWQEARNFYKTRKRNLLNNGSFTVTEEKAARPTLPSNVVLITVPSMDNITKPQQRGFYLNPQGKTSVCVLHELIQKILKCTIYYAYNETRSSATPYHCVAKLVTNCATNKHIIGSSITDKLMCLKERYRLQQEQQEKGTEEYITVGEGLGNSKKHAKLMAAKKAVENLFHGIEFDNEGMAICNKNVENENSQKNSVVDISTAQIESDKNQIFDSLSVCDSRVSEYCARAGQPAPYLVLQEYLKRNSAFGDTEIVTQIRRLRFKKHRFEMKIGKYEVAVECANKREGKQKAAQKMLSEFLPQNTTWGSILRLYGYETQQKQKEARKNKESIIKLQGEVRTHNENSFNAIEPNTIILDKLKSEMLKLTDNLIEKKFRSLNSFNVEQQNVSQKRSIESTEPENDFPAKKTRFEICSLTTEQINVLEELVDLFNINAKRQKEIGFSDLPILDEAQLCEISQRVAKLFPDKKIPFM